VSFHVPEKFRIRTGRHASDASLGNNGAFEVKLRHGQTVYVDRLGRCRLGTRQRQPARQDPDVGRNVPGQGAVLGR